MDLSIIYSLGIEDLWELFRSEIREAISDEKDTLKKKSHIAVLNAVKNGSEEIDVDLRLIISGQYKDYLKYNLVEINRKNYNLYKFLDDIEMRKDLMRKWLKVNWGITGLGSARTEEQSESKEVEVITNS